MTFKPFVYQVPFLTVTSTMNVVSKEWCRIALHTASAVTRPREALWWYCPVNQTRLNVGSNRTGQLRGKQFVVLSSSLFSPHSFHCLSPFFPLTDDRPSVGCLVHFEKPQWFRTKWHVQFVLSAVVAPIIYFYGCYCFTLGEEKKWICIWSVYPALEMMTGLNAPQGMFSWLYGSQLLTKSMHTVACLTAIETQHFMHNMLKFITA